MHLGSFAVIRQFLPIAGQIDGHSEGSMAETVRPARLGWLDGLRGLAAMQVVLMHYVFAFLPAIASIYPVDLHDGWWENLTNIPLVYLFDGSSAVYLFFIMSGVVLTQAFTSRPFAFLPAVIRRIVRLGMPMAAAILLAAALYALLPDAHVIAGDRSGSVALRDIGPHGISVAAIIHQIAFEGLLTGFSGWSLLPGWATSHMHLTSRVEGFDTPLWTLHIEFCGSLLIMLLVMVRASTSQPIYRATCLILLYFFALNPMSLFIIGHFAANHLPKNKRRAWQGIFGVVILGLGILLCTIRTIGAISVLWRLLPTPPLGLPSDQASLQKMIGAILVFGGIACLPILQSHLERPIMRSLGRISFSLYLSHYPILFTVIAASFTLLDGFVPYAANVASLSVAGIGLSLALAVPFERWIDRPSIMLSRMAAQSCRRVRAPVAVINAA